MIKLQSINQNSRSKKQVERKKLDDSDVQVQLASLSGWAADGGKLHRRFEFHNFAAALAFVNRAGELAEAADHHPDIRLGWGYAEFEITTHDRGGITDFDFALAKQIEGLN
jgi:4a-hydroxytetrahydrobiopterin dehydratase